MHQNTFSKLISQLLFFFFACLYYRNVLNICWPVSVATCSFPLCVTCFPLRLSLFLFFPSFFSQSPPDCINHQPSSSEVSRLRSLCTSCMNWNHRRWMMTRRRRKSERLQLQQLKDTPTLRTRTRSPKPSLPRVNRCRWCAHYLIMDAEIEFLCCGKFEQSPFLKRSHSLIVSQMDRGGAGDAACSASSARN